MTDSLEIYRRADSIVRRYGTRNPEKIARDLGIVIYDNLETSSLLGMYCCKWRHRFIFLNTRLEEHMRQNVIAHEIGHDQQHRKLAMRGGLQEFTLFSMKSQTEYEANAFACHLMLATDDVLDYVHQGYDAVQIAQMTNTDINMVLIKIAELNKLGYDLRVPMEPDGCFLKDTDPERASVMDDDKL